MKFINPFHKQQAIQIVEKLNEFIENASNQKNDSDALSYFQQARDIMLQLKPFYDEGVINLTPDYDTLLSQIQETIDSLSFPEPSNAACRFCESKFPIQDLSERNLCPECEKNVSKIMPAIFREIGAEYRQLELNLARDFMVQISLAQAMIDQANVLLPYEQKGIMAFKPSIQTIISDLNNRIEKWNNPPQSTFFIKTFSLSHPQQIRKSREIPPSHSEALLIIYNASAVIGPKRHEINQDIIAKYYASKSQLDVLAVAIAYSREGAKYRKQAILYYEKYIQSPVCVPMMKYSNTDRPLFSMWEIYSDLGNLYEREYEFEKAIRCYERLIQESKESNPADYTRIGDVLTKIDINQCVEYYRSLQTKAPYQKHKYAFDTALAEALEKQREGYVYHPRPHK